MTSPIPRFLQWLRPSRQPRRQLPRHSPLHLPGGVRTGEGSGELQCVGRALCRFRWLPFDAVPAAQRRAFVRLQLEAWAPFESNGYAVVSGDEGAMAFAWDQAAFENRALGAGLPTQPAITWPETMLLAAHEDGVVLQACSAGVEGQVWRSRQLVASRWWPEAPDVTAWLNFQRSAGVPPGAQVPQVPSVDVSGSPQLLDEPWAPVMTLHAILERARLRQHALAAALIAALALPALALLHANWMLARQIDALEAQKAQLTAEAQPVLVARGQALAAAADLDTLRAAVERPDALLLLSHIGNQLPSDGNRIRNLELDGRRLRLVLAVPAGTPRITYVRALEGGDWLQDVREDTLESTPGSVALSAQLRGTRPTSAAPASAPAALGASAPSVSGGPGSAAQSATGAAAEARR